ncbi:transporter [Pseudohalioglobus lutimaris]|uniref:Transporter n=1 Tax=Pseudohalioglobus lutimaris TaxID=1737061 RepID=A0A2N5WYW0_9GAMM|nr:transporter [Pseudohalioglobus lutimaris]PLW67435.1 transporter [Pseudohalioglobus lutimaris]
MKKLLIFCAMLGVVSGAMAQELTPRAYWPAPQGTQVLTVGIVHTDGDIVPDPSLPLTGIDSSITSGVLGYLNTLDLFGRTAFIILEQAYSNGETNARVGDIGELQRDYQGRGDFAATLAVNLMGAPTMNREEFAELRRNPRPILGASVKVVAPTGEYEKDRVVNVGGNRWAAKFELGYVTVLKPKWLLEVEAGVWVFDDNDDFLGMTRKQGSIKSLELHLVRRFSPGFWASLDVNGYRGGQSSVGGQRRNDLQRDSKLGATLVFPIARKHAVKVAYSTGSINNSDEDFNLYQVSYQRLF